MTANYPELQRLEQTVWTICDLFNETPFQKPRTFEEVVDWAKDKGLIDKYEWTEIRQAADMGWP
jgi:phage pi2 protein 07